MKSKCIQYVTVITALLLLVSAYTQAEIWVTLPYPDNIALKDANKKVDLDEADPITLFSLNDLFDSAKTDSIIVAALITKGGENQSLTAAYVNPLDILNNFFKRVPHNKHAIMTETAYKNLKRTYKHENPEYLAGGHSFNTHLLKTDERFTTPDEDDRRPHHRKPPFFVDPVKDLFIENIYFFKITRTQKQDGSFDYKAEYIGNLEEIVKNSDTIANLQAELINNFEGDATAKKQELVKLATRYKDAKEFEIATALVDIVEKRILSPQERERLSLEKAINDILTYSGSSKFQPGYIQHIFDEKIKRPGLKIPLKDFQNIILKKTPVFAPFPDELFDLINTNAPLIAEYQTDKEGTLKKLYEHFINYLNTYPYLQSEQRTFMHRLKKIKTDNNQIKKEIEAIVKTYERARTEKTQQIVTDIKNSRNIFNIQDILTIHQNDLEITLPQFQEIIQHLFTIDPTIPHIIYNFMENNKKSIAMEVVNVPAMEQLNLTLNVYFITQLKHALKTLTQQEKQTFFDNLKQIKTNFEPLKKVITDLPKTEHKQNLLDQIARAQSGDQAALMYQQKRGLDFSDIVDIVSAIARVYIIKDNDPFKAYTFIVGHIFADTEGPIIEMLMTSQEQLQKLPSRDVPAFIKSLEKIAEKERDLRYHIRNIIASVQQREMSDKLLISLGQALKSI